MSDDDLIRRGDVLRLIIGTAHPQRGPSTDLQRMIRAIPATDARADALREAAEAWQAFKAANTTTDHFNAVERLDAILIGEART